MSISRTYAATPRPRSLALAALASAIALGWLGLGPSAAPASGAYFPGEAVAWTPTQKSCMSLLSAYRHDGYRITKLCAYSSKHNEWYFQYWD